MTAQGGDPGRAQLHPRPHVRVAGRGGPGGGPHQAAPPPRARGPAGHPPPLRPARAARDEQPRPGAALEDDLSPRPCVVCRCWAARGRRPRSAWRRRGSCPRCSAPASRTCASRSCSRYSRSASSSRPVGASRRGDRQNTKINK